MQSSETRNAPLHELPQTPADPRCRVEMLGALRLIHGDQITTRFARQKAAALLAYLALHPRPQSREQLIDLFWPDMDLPAGRDNLSTTLASLRRQLEPPGVRQGSVLMTTHAQVGLNPAAITTDVAAFEQFLSEAAQAEEVGLRAERLQCAVTLYQGDMLPGVYFDWAVRESERLQARMMEALGQLIQDRETLGDLAGALESTQRAVALDPYSEELHTQLIRFYVANGHVGTAREANRKFERMFAKEFGAAPSVETRQTVARLLAKASTVPRVDTPVSLPRTTGRPRKTEQPPLHSIAEREASSVQPVAPPAVLSRFFGREGEIAELAQLLLPSKATPVGPDLPDDPCRIVTLIGPGGIGKTRLALEFTRKAAQRFGFWCGFVPLADLTDSSQIADQIANALRLPPDSNSNPLERVLSFFRQQGRPGAPVLLVIDNLEHLLSQNASDDSFIPDAPDIAANIVQALLEGVPGLTILCTSRRRLGLRGERLVDVRPLPIPDAPHAKADADALAALAAVPSVRLYLDRAQSVRPDFGLTPTNAAAVAALCRQLEGSPLALELAAAWVRVLPPRKMWERLTQGLDIPAGSYADLPTRHRSLAATLDWSWRLLRPAAQRLLARLSVFHGGWSLEAAETVCEEPEALNVLAELQEASLVMAAEDASGEVRYRFLETVRAFARQRSVEWEEWEAAQRRHAAYFQALAEEADTHLRGPDQALWLARMEAEHDNLRAALDFRASTETDAGLELTCVLARFWRVRGHWSEARRRLHTALIQAGDSVPIALRARGLNAAGAFALTQGDYAQARTLWMQTLELRRQLGDRARIADTLHNLGYLAVVQGDYAQARPLYEEALATQRELGDQTAVADELHHLGLVAHEQGDLAQAHTLYKESLMLRRPLGDQRGIALTLNNLANVASAQNDRAQARSLLEESLALHQELGDQQGIGLVLNNLANVMSQEGDSTGALTLLKEALSIQYEIGDRAGSIGSLLKLAQIVLDIGQPDRAIRLLGAMETARQSFSIPESEAIAQLRATVTDGSHAILDEAAFASEYTAGQKMTLEEAVAYALE
jgi:predicted ATPase/DNA-binding SARP family transcriptional activator